MASTTAAAHTASYTVVIDGHTAAESTWTLGVRFATRAAAIAACDQANAEAAALAVTSHRWHVEAV